jgi:hypothetical protein
MRINLKFSSECIGQIRSSLFTKIKESDQTNEYFQR